MELTQNVMLQLWVRSAAEAEDLENAIKSLPVSLGFSNLPKYGDRPRLVVMSGGDKDHEVILRPYQCNIANIYLGKGVRGIARFEDGSRTVLYQGRRFNLFNMPLWE